MAGNGSDDKWERLREWEERTGRTSSPRTYTTPAWKPGDTPF